MLYSYQKQTRQLPSPGASSVQRSSLASSEIVPSSEPVRNLPVDLSKSSPIGLYDEDTKTEGCTKTPAQVFKIY